MEQEVIKQPLQRQGPEVLGVPEVSGAERARVDAKPLERPQESGASPADVVIPDTEAGPGVIPELEALDIKKVESVLSEGLADIYNALPADVQPAFRAAGEEAARQIYELLKAVTVEISKVITVMRHWLRLIPGVSGDYLEQEVKIKTDKLLRLRKSNMN